MSGLLLGAAAATKGTCLPLAAALGLLSRGTRRHAGPACAGAILPLLPWALKSWLILGNPLFPLLYSVIPTFRFSELNLPLQAAFFQPWTDPRARSILSLPASTFSFFLSEHVALPLAAAGCLAFGRNRAAVLAALAGGAAILYATHIPRFAVPAAVLMAFLAGRDVTGFGLMPASAWRVAASAAVAAGFFIHPFPAGLARAGSSLEEGRRRELLDLLEVSRFTARALPGRPVLLAGDARSFPFSQRVISAGALYETPLVWRLLRETPDAARLRVRFRQLGTDMIVYNFVGALGGAGRAWPGGWENGDLVRYRDFAARFLEIARPPARIDRAGGGFYVFRILNRPRERAAGLVYHLPGIEAIFAEGDEELRLHDRPAEAIKRYRSLARILPNTGVIAEKIAYASYLMGEHRQALEALDPYVAAGWVGELSLVIHGASALELGMRDKARASLERAIALYPEHRQALEASLARLASAPKE